jgi:hypothetical protein
MDLGEDGKSFREELGPGRLGEEARDQRTRELNRRQCHLLDHLPLALPFSRR